MKKLAIILAILFPLAANAETMVLKYDGTWEGIKAGELKLKNIETNDSYDVQVDVDTAGVVKSLTKFSSHSDTSGKLEAGKYSPVKYDGQWQTKKNSPHIIVSYNDNGEASEDANPPENRNKRPFVEQQFKQNSFDPVTAIFEVRRQIKAIIESSQQLPQQFQVKIFDARRVFTGNFTIIGYDKKRIDGISQKLLHVSFNRTAIAGFNAKELEKLKNFNPTFDIYLDEDYIPVIGYGEAVIGHTEMQLVAKCLGDKCGQ